MLFSFSSQSIPEAIGSGALGIAPSFTTTSHHNNSHHQRSLASHTRSRSLSKPPVTESLCASHHHSYASKHHITATTSTATSPESLIECSKLDEEFQNEIQLIIASLPHLNKHDRIRVDLWIKKLCINTPNPIWKQNRNLYTRILARMATLLNISDPFTRLPPDSALPFITKAELPTPALNILRDLEREKGISSSSMRPPVASTSQTTSVQPSPNKQTTSHRRNRSQNHSVYENVVNQLSRASKGPSKRSSSNFSQQSQQAASTSNETIQPTKRPPTYSISLHQSTSNSTHNSTSFNNQRSYVYNSNLPSSSTLHTTSHSMPICISCKSSSSTAAATPGMQARVVPDHQQNASPLHSIDQLKLISAVEAIVTSKTNHHLQNQPYSHHRHDTNKTSDQQQQQLSPNYSSANPGSTSIRSTTSQFNQQHKLLLLQQQQHKQWTLNAEEENESSNDIKNNQENLSDMNNDSNHDLESLSCNKLSLLEEKDLVRDLNLKQTRISHLQRQIDSLKADNQSIKASQNNYQSVLTKAFSYLAGQANQFKDNSQYSSLMRDLSTIGGNQSARLLEDISNGNQGNNSNSQRSTTSMKPLSSSSSQSQPNKSSLDCNYQQHAETIKQKLHRTNQDTYEFLSYLNSIKENLQ